MKEPAGLKHGMAERLRAAVHFLERNIGFSRIGFALSLTIIIVAVVVLYHILSDLDVEALLDALEATDWRTLAIAGFFVAAGYLTLTFYDLFALRTIGRSDVPYRIAALAGFTSYAVGHNVGASVFSGGAVRYRIYSAWGLGVIEVTKICFIAGLTFWLGNATLLGIGVLEAPQAARAVDQLPIWLNRLIALVILTVLSAYVAWVWVKPRVIGREGWQVTLPGGPLTLLQIGIGILDLFCCALAMYMLVPDEPNLGFITGGGDLRCRDAARLCQPRAGRPGRVRRRHDGGAVAVRQGRPAGRSAAFPSSILHRSVHAFAAHPGNARSSAGAGGAAPHAAGAQYRWLRPSWSGKKPTCLDAEVERRPRRDIGEKHTNDFA